MPMFTNGPTCSFIGRHPAPCAGKLHQCDVQMVATLDGTPVDAPVEKTYACEGHFPDVTDPQFKLCICELCKKRAAKK